MLSRFRCRPAATAALVFVAFAALACRDSTAPDSASPAPSPALIGERELLGLGPLLPTLLGCPGGAGSRVEAEIGPGGGTLSAEGQTVTIPAGAVAVPTWFELVVPRSDVLEVRVNAVGRSHYTFEAPVAITLAYGRCPLSLGALLSAPLAAHIDEETRSVLAVMPSRWYPLRREVRLSTGHLSGYAIAY